MQRAETATVAVFTLCLSFAGTTSCMRSRTTTELSMRDGWKLSKEGAAPDPSTTFSISISDSGEPDVADDESWVFYEFTIPDDGKRELPVTFTHLSGLRTAAGVWSSETTSFSDGTFTLWRAVPGGFVASYDLGSGPNHVAGRGVVRPEGRRRSAVWPYDPREPKPSRFDKFVDTLKLAWEGAI